MAWRPFLASRKAKIRFYSISTISDKIPVVDKSAAHNTTLNLSSCFVDPRQPTLACSPGPQNILSVPVNKYSIIYVKEKENKHQKETRKFYNFCSRILLFTGECDVRRSYLAVIQLPAGDTILSLTLYTMYYTLYRLVRVKPA